MKASQSKHQFPAEVVPLQKSSGGLNWCPSIVGGQGGLNFPLPVPFNPGSRPVFFGSRPFAFFRLRNIAQCCIIFLFPFFSRFPPPWESRFPPPLLPPPVHLPPPFSPGLPPPCPPPPHTPSIHYRENLDFTPAGIRVAFSYRRTQNECQAKVFLRKSRKRKPSKVT